MNLKIKSLKFIGSSTLSSGTANQIRRYQYKKPEESAEDLKKIYC